MGLTTLEVSNAKPRAKLYRLFDGHGLYLEITPTGAKRWRVKYRLHGRERRLSLGVFPATSLALARERLKDVQAQGQAGIDPALARLATENLKALPAVENVEGVAREWYAKFSPAWGAESRRENLAQA